MKSVPKKPRSSNRPATASPGNRCPPLPPQAIATPLTGTVISLSLAGAGTVVRARRPAQNRLQLVAEMGITGESKLGLKLLRELAISQLFDCIPATQLTRKALRGYCESLSENPLQLPLMVHRN